MDYSKRLSISYYKEVTAINEEHHVYLVKHTATGKIYTKKQLGIYNKEIYTWLLDNPIKGIPTIRELYEEDGILTVIEDYISGTPLDEVINSGNLTIESITAYMLELCHILEPLHGQNPPMIHRDIKPSNIIITEHNRVFLLDFNAAKYYTNPEANDTILLGTKGYAAPEQYGFGSSSPKTDIYSLGILFREMYSSLHENSYSTNKTNTNVNKHFHKIIEKATQINPADRYESVSALAKDISNKCNVANITPDNHLLEIDYHNQHTGTKSKSTFNKFLPPGFRTKTPWKMMLAISLYACIFMMSMSLESVNNENNSTTVNDLWAMRIFMFLMIISFIFIPCNYLNIQALMPLCKSSKTIIRYIGITLLVFLIDTLLLFMMAIIAVTLP